MTIHRKHRSFTILAAVISSVFVLASCQSAPSSSAQPSIDIDGNNYRADNRGNVENCPLSAEEQAMLDAVNAERRRSQRCGIKSFQPVHPLAWDCRLGEAARMHSNDMASQNFIDHTGSNQQIAGDRIQSTGYRWLSYGENIAAEMHNVQNVMKHWMESPHHCANIMSPQFDDFGAAVTRTDRADFVDYWTQVMARERKR